MGLLYILMYCNCNIREESLIQIKYDLHRQIPATLFIEEYDHLGYNAV
jgi:hypothetical protein